MGLRIYGIGIGNYRSFCSDEMARISLCKKVLVLTGQNNTGKSSLLQACKRLIDAMDCDKSRCYIEDRAFSKDDLPSHLTGQPVKGSVCLSINEVNEWFDGLRYHTNAPDATVLTSAKELLTTKAFSDSNHEFCWIDLICGTKDSNDYPWIAPDPSQFDRALSEMLDSTKEETLRAFHELASSVWGIAPEFDTDYELMVSSMLRTVNYPKTVLIPAIRKVEKLKKGASNVFLSPSGEGFPEKLLKLRNHSAKNHEEASACVKRFEELVRRVLDEPDMSYSVDFDTHEVSFQTESSPMLPITELGTGIEELLVLALIVATTHDSIICIEEPEIHLHPTLIRRLVDCLQRDECGNRFILATHSPTLINAPDVNVTHITKRGGVSHARTISGIVEGRDVLDDIGARASDILLSNYVIWVEGPSDRIYVNAWIHELDSALQEGIHYSIVTYGGKLLSGFTAAGDGGQDLEKLIQLMRVNPHFCVLMDSDVTSAGGEINETKRRIEAECQASANLSWVTWGATIENYYPGERIASALKELYPGESYSHVLDDRYVHPLGSPFDTRKTKNPDKVRVAHKLVETPILDSDARDTELKDKVSLLVKEIRKASQL